MLRTSCPLWMTGLVLLLVAGCGRQPQGDGAIYAVQWWVPWAVGFFGLLFVPLGLLIRRRTIYGWILMVVGPLLALLIAPMVATDKVTVDKDRFQNVHGFWWSKDIETVYYKDVRQMTVREEVKQGRHGPEYSYFLDCQMKNGPMITVPIGDLMKKAWPELADNAVKKGVPVFGPQSF